MLLYNIDELKDYLKMSNEFTDHDVLLEMLFNSVCQEVKQFIGFDLSETTYTNEIHNIPYFTRNLQTKAYPLITPDSGEILTISVNDTALATIDGYIDYDMDGNIEFKETVNLRLGYYKNKILVSYKAGYSEFPDDAKEKIFKLIKLNYEEEGTDIQQIHDLGLTKTKEPKRGGYPQDVYKVFNSYRRNVV